MAKLGILDGADVVYLDGIDSPQAVRAYVPIGGRAPVHASATGKAIIAYLPNERLKSLGISGRRYTAKTVVGSDALLKEFEQIRKRGYAVNRGEWAEDVGAVASSIFNANGDPIGSVGIILPLVRLSPAKIPQMGAWVIKAATEISTKLGYRADARIAGLKRA
jgi:DNA-binding IclR family transcriptional regulator